MDYEGLARQYVFAATGREGDEIAAMAAAGLSKSPRGLVQWVESVQTFVCTDRTTEPDEGDFVRRAKAIKFLGATLGQLRGRLVLTEPQVTVLVAFFCSQYGKDSSGELASTEALAALAEMAGFTAEHGASIILAISELGADHFRKHPAGTRRAAYRLLHAVARAEPVKTAGLGADQDQAKRTLRVLLALAASERDPACLMAWFGFLATFHHLYDLADPTLVREAFGRFSSYFPISLPAGRASADGITSDDLKQALRGCFSAHHALAEHAFPYLIGKLDQGEGLAPAVRADIIKTMDQCLSQYDHAAQTIAPFAAKLWSSLMYEVRNGDEPNAAQLAMGPIQALSSRLEGADLDRFLARVVSDCYQDMLDPAYVAQAGKLMAAVMSANAAIFGKLATGTIDFICQHMLSPGDGPHQVENLVLILNTVLKIGLAFQPTGADAKFPAAAAGAAEAPINPSLIADLYGRIYLPLTNQCLEPYADEEARSAARNALPGLGHLAKMQYELCWQSARLDLLGADPICDSICTTLATIILDQPTPPDFLPVIEEAVATLTTISAVYPRAIRKLWARVINPPPISSVALQDAISKMVYIGTKELPVAGDQIDRFAYVIGALLAMLRTALFRDDPLDMRLELVRGMLNAMTQFHARFIPATYRAALPGTILQNDVRSKYKDLMCLVESDEELAHRCPVVRPDKDWDFNSTFVSICLFAARQLIRRTTRVYTARTDNSLGIRLAPEFGLHHAGGLHDIETDFLIAAADIARFSIRLIEAQSQLELNLPWEVFALFHGSETRLVPAANGPDMPIAVVNLMMRPNYPDDEPEGVYPYVAFSKNSETTSRLANGNIAILSLGIAQGLCPIGVETLWENQKVHKLFVSALLSKPGGPAWPAGSVEPGAPAAENTAVLVLVANIANKYPVETEGNLLNLMELQVESAGRDEGGLGPVIEEQIQFTGTDQERISQVTAVATVLSGVIRRFKGPGLNFLLSSMVRLPSSARLGLALGRELESVVSPMLDEKNGIIMEIPTWRTRVYHQLIRPMIERAIPGPDSSGRDQLISYSYRTTLIMMIQWIPFPIYDDDADQILRICIQFGQESAANKELGICLQVMVNILTLSPDRGRDHISSIIQICQRIMNSEDPAWPGWMPVAYADFQPATEHTVSECRRNVLILLVLIRLQYDGDQMADIQASTPSVRRLLASATGLHARMVRKQARVGRSAWMNPS